MNKRIIELRKCLGMTTEKFSSFIGVASSAIESIEKGDMIPTEQIIFAICKEFGVNETWLVTGEGSMLKQIAVNELEVLSKKHELTQLECLILEKYLRLSIPDRAAVVDAIKERSYGNEKTS